MLGICSAKSLMFATHSQFALTMCTRLNHRANTRKKLEANVIRINLALRSLSVRLSGEPELRSR